MGAGQSVAVQEHLHKWEVALQELEQVSGTNRQITDGDRFHGSKTGEEPEARPAVTGRRGSSFVGVTNTGSNSVAIENVGSLGRPRSAQVEGGKPSTFGHSPLENSITSGQQSKFTRQQVLDMKKARMALFSSYENKQSGPITGLMECGHFGAVAVALSYLMGGARNETDRRKRVTVEDIFFAAQVPLFMLHTGAPHLPIMADVIREFLDVDNRFKGDYALEELHLDISPTTGQVDLGPNDTGDRQTRMSLSDFHQAITHDCEEETQVIRIVNYDPYVLEQEMRVDAYEDEEEQNRSQLANSVLGSPLPPRAKSKYSPLNDGAYAVIVDVRNAVQLMVTIAEGVVSDSLNVTLTEVPASSLFKAMMSAEEGRRARGFVRIYRRDVEASMVRQDVDNFWTPELCSGKVLGTTREGIHAFAVSHLMSPHIVVVAWAIHLLRGARVATHGYGNGLPVSDIIAKMKLPAETFINGSATLDQTFEMTKEYLRLAGWGFTVRVYPVLTKISREDAVPTISVFDLENILLDVQQHNDDPESPKHVMLIMYNANVAHNVLYIADKPQWCVLAGYDAEAQTALLIDAHPKTFSRTWTCSLDRLHKAMTGTGYMIMSKEEKPIVGAPKSIAPMVQERLNLLETQEQQGALGFNYAAKAGVRTFHYPQLPLMPTMVALACTRVGLFTTFEDVIQAFPTSITSLVNRVFTLESLAVCFGRYFTHRQLQNEMKLELHHGELDDAGRAMLTADAFKEAINAALALPTTTTLIVHFDASQLLVNGASHPFGSLGIVIGYEKERDLVAVSDCNPNSYARNWIVPLPHLLNAITDSEKLRVNRSLGFLCLTRGPRSEEPDFPPEYCRSDFELELLPVQNLFHVSPSSHFQAMSLAFAMLGDFYSPEEIFYEAYLKTKVDQRLRGSQAYAWRDVDVSLSVINTDIDAAFMAKVCTKFLESRTMHRNSAANLKALAAKSQSFVRVECLDDMDNDDVVGDLLKEVTSSKDTVLLLNYDTSKVITPAPQLSRSVAMVRSYDPEKKLVELWDAEYAVFGLSLVVPVRKLIEMGDLANEGRSPYGFVRFTRVSGAANTAAAKPKLMSAPSDDDDEPAIVRGATVFDV